MTVWAGALDPKRRKIYSRLKIMKKGENNDFLKSIYLGKMHSDTSGGK